ncbi:MAG: hypothetical protein ACRDKU_07960 [Gaiellaceae bacterium]
MDRIEVEERIREALREWEDGRAALSEFEGEDIGVIPVEPPLSGADREVTVALNATLELIYARGWETGDTTYGEAGNIVLNELAHRGLPIVSRAPWRPPER